MKQIIGMIIEHFDKRFKYSCFIEPCFDILSRMTREPERKSAADDDVLPTFNISAEMEE